MKNLCFGSDLKNNATTIRYSGVPEKASSKIEVVTGYSHISNHFWIGIENPVTIQAIEVKKGMREARRCEPPWLPRLKIDCLNLSKVTRHCQYPAKNKD